ncbi:chaperone modulator CbpM [Membranihabitans maritimus]|uniref:chaperone modulator CbpM n=1 Tax=Membranihabitans maritimus TaxID=2904244 RepID=UPI001F454058|nr:chaperone modulator CbpM [Membranihabitans maritimus]
MSLQEYILIREIMEYHRVNRSEIRELEYHGLVEIIKIEEEECIPPAELDNFERIIRLYKELGVNPQGIDVIVRLREQIIELKNELRQLKRGN